MRIFTFGSKGLDLGYRQSDRAPFEILECGMVILGESWALHRSQGDD